MHVEHRYLVPPGVLLGVLTDPAFLTARNERYGGAGAPVVSRENGQVVITVPRQLPMAHVPSVFHRFVGDGRFTERDTWSSIGDDRAIGSWLVDVGKAPIQLSGTHTITATGHGSVHVVAGDVKVSIPVVGGKLAREVVAHLTDLISHEMAFAAEWLESRPAS
ncbi:MAG: hypothetical protein QOG53_1243 [Frankiales bacterium]|jgi:hypothetical protein|nr:hypothetical protein [Frankiales bacterium]